MLKQEKVEVYCDNINSKSGYFVLLVQKLDYMNLS